MKKNVTYLLLAGLSIAALQLVVAGQSRKPAFRDYIIADNYRGTPARVNLSAPPAARYYRTRLREGAAKGPNFAGHYTIITWGCGSDCYDIAVVDARTGRVWFAPFTGAIDLEFHRSSRLLIVDPEPERRKRFPGGLPPGFGDAPEVFFVWRANRFVQVYPTDGTKPLPAIR